MSDAPGVFWLKVDKHYYVCCALEPKTCMEPVRYVKLKRWRGSVLRLTSFALCKKHWGVRNA